MSEVLNVEKVGRNDNFFDLSGHSFLAVTLIGRMRRKGLKTDVRSLFTSSTLKDLASMIENKTVTSNIDVHVEYHLNQFKKKTKVIAKLDNLNKMEVTI